MSLINWRAISRAPFDLAGSAVWSVIAVGLHAVMRVAKALQVGRVKAQCVINAAIIFFEFSDVVNVTGCSAYALRQTIHAQRVG